MAFTKLSSTKLATGHSRRLRCFVLEAVFCSEGGYVSFILCNHQLYIVAEKCGSVVGSNGSRTDQVQSRCGGMVYTGGG